MDVQRSGEVLSAEEKRQCATLTAIIKISYNEIDDLPVREHRDELVPVTQIKFKVWRAGETHPAKLGLLLLVYSHVRGPRLREAHPVDKRTPVRVARALDLEYKRKVVNADTPGNLFYRAPEFIASRVVSRRAVALLSAVVLALVGSAEAESGRSVHSSNVGDAYQSCSSSGGLGRVVGRGGESDPASFRFAMVYRSTAGASGCICGLEQKKRH
ncbi:hypothetical protein DFH09DRAFT_1091702 [Mycena vulgaris]|nr:hypothetical protein DFH09DRAFT_1091702 [Mycena vulgaris]